MDHPLPGKDMPSQFGEDMYLVAFEHTPIGLAFLTTDRQIIRTNPALSRILGYSEEEMCELGLNALTHPDDRGSYAAVHADLLAGRRTRYELEKRYLHRDGHVVWASLQVGAIPDADGHITMLVSQVHDVSERVAAQQQTAWLADHDPLTGTVNRAGLLRDLDRVVALDRVRSSYGGSCRTAVLYIDLDHFKLLNDKHGHASGDRYLVQLVERINKVMRETDVLARMGGDEFVLLAHEVTDLAQARAVAESVRSAVNYLAAELEESSRVSASIGVALTPGSSSSDLLARADAALYKAKRAGGDQIVIG